MSLFKVLIAGAAAAFLSLGTAQAGQIGSDYHDYGHLPDCNGGGGGGGGGSNCTNVDMTRGAVQIWNFKCSGGLSATCADALPGPLNPKVITANRIYNGYYTGPINFSDNSTNTVKAFLNSAGGIILRLDQWSDADIEHGFCAIKPLSVELQQQLRYRHDHGLQIHANVHAGSVHPA